jgi:hypothetical protein|tara:strand:+ start:129 stop:365 length:237 start_codon:yes stop_codon:yes gene_type:complete
MSLKRLDDYFKILKPKAKRHDPSYGKAKRLAKKLGIKITVERDAVGNGYWIETDLIQDERFCSSWEEVLGKLKEIEKK